MTVRLGPSNHPPLWVEELDFVAGQAWVKRPCYHLVVSWDPSDIVHPSEMESVAAWLVEALGLWEHQVLVVEVEETPQPRMHIVVNRVHPNHGKPKEIYVKAPLGSNLVTSTFEMEMGGDWNSKKRVWVFPSEEKHDLEVVLDELWGDRAPKVKFGKRHGVWRGRNDGAIIEETLRELECEFGWRQEQSSLSNRPKS